MGRLVRALGLGLLVTGVLGGPGPALHAAPKPAAWTILVYHDADCDLEAPMLDDLDELAAVGSTEAVRVVALLDRSPKATPKGRYADRPVGGLAEGKGARYVEVRKGALVEVAALPEEPNLGDPATLVAFVERGMREFPAERYALVFGDHGLAWPGVCADESHDDDFLTTGELRAALEQVVAAHGRLDLVGFDACLMAATEVATCLAPFAQVMVASEELEPGTGWWYAPVLEALVAAPTTDAAALGTTIADTFQASFERQPGVADRNDGQDITLSVVDLDKVEAVGAAASALGEALGKALATGGRPAWLAVAKARAAAEQYGRSADPRANGAQMLDLVDLARRVGAGLPAVAPFVAKVEQAVAAAVFHRVQGPARPDARGLSVWLPRAAAPGELDAYRATPFGGGPWGGFAAAYLALADRDTEKPAASEAAGSAEAVEAEHPVTVTATAASPDDLAQALFVVARRTDDGVLVAGSMPTDADAEGKLSEAWSGGWFTLEDGAQRLLCPITGYEDVDEEGKQWLADVPAQVRVAGEEAWEDVTLTFLVEEAEDGSVHGEFLDATKFDDAGPREIPLEAGDEVRAVYVRVGDDGVATPVVVEDAVLKVDDEDNLKIGWERVPAGAWLVGFWLEDHAGNSAVTLAPVTVK